MCRRPWITVSGETLCLFSDVTEQRMDPNKQNVGWLPLCPASVNGETQGCSPDPEHRQFGCNPAVLLADRVSPVLRGKARAAKLALNANGTSARNSTAAGAPGACRPCRLSVFTAWSECSASCGSNGRQKRSRTVLQVPTCGAKCGK